MSDVISINEGRHVAPAKWTPLQKLMFRVAFIYLILTGSYWVFIFADRMTAAVSKPFNAVWHPLAQWTAVHLLHWPAGVEPHFLYDTRYLYSLLSCWILFAVLVAGAWSLLDRERRDYVGLNHWLRVFLRYVLAYILLHYGMDKVFLIQFPAPSLARLAEPFGEYSPSSLMWAFIGSSTVYTVFGGLAEVLAGVLLLWRRTTTLGALIGFAVMFNVTVMDFSYDVGVKLLCLHILLMATYLVLPDAHRLLQFFVLNRATAAAHLDPAPLTRTQQRIAWGLKALILVLLIAPLTLREWKSYREMGAGAPRPPLYGLYEVDGFTLAGVEHPPLLTDTARWRSVILETPETIVLRHMDGSLSSYRMHYDAAQHTIAFDAKGDAADKSLLAVTQPSADSMTIEGTFAGAPVSARLHRVDRSSFTLVNRGFHWVSESSFVR
jgi:uncharacterized membrane protein YphA (DoxX/SURF4 family)